MKRIWRKTGERNLLKQYSWGVSNFTSSNFEKVCGVNESFQLPPSKLSNIAAVFTVLQRQIYPLLTKPILFLIYFYSFVFSFHYRKLFFPSHFYSSLSVLKQLWTEHNYVPQRKVFIWTVYDLTQPYLYFYLYLVKRIILT